MLKMGMDDFVRMSADTNNADALFVYKYRKGTKRNIDILNENALWMPLLCALNDPEDLSIFADIYRNDTNYKSFVEMLNRSAFCLSFGRSDDNAYLWEHYTDNCSGFVLEYPRNLIAKTLEEANFHYCDKIVNYEVDKVKNVDEMFNKWKSGKPIDEFVETATFFTKGLRWEPEGEYRFSVGNNLPIDEYYRVSGVKLKNIIPSRIIIGYNASESLKQKLLTYANKNYVIINIQKVSNGSI